MPDKPKNNNDLLISVVIPSYNRGPLLAQMVEQLWTQTLEPAKYEIIVVDNHSADDTPEIAADLITRAPCKMRCHRMPPHKGPDAARNAGARLARGEFVLLLDSDVQLERGWMAVALRAARRDPRVGVVSGKVLYDKLPDVLNSYGGEMGQFGLAWDALEGQPAADATKARDWLWVSTSAMLVRRDVYLAIGGFDEVFFQTYEDSDIGWRINLHDFRVISIPEAKAYHQVSISVEPRSYEWVFNYCKNRLRSLLKNAGLLRLSWALPAYLGYSLLDIIVRPQRGIKTRALWWNVTHLQDTLRLRRQVQTNRMASEREIAHLFSRRWFPPEMLGQRRRRIQGVEKTARREVMPPTVEPK